MKLRGISNKDTRAAVRRLVASGRWTAELTAGNHVLLRGPGGAVIRCALTSGPEHRRIASEARRAEARAGVG